MKRPTYKQQRAALSDVLDTLVSLRVLRGPTSAALCRRGAQGAMQNMLHALGVHEWKGDVVDVLRDLLGRHCRNGLQCLEPKSCVCICEGCRRTK